MQSCLGKALKYKSPRVPNFLENIVGRGQDVCAVTDTFLSGFLEDPLCQLGFVLFVFVLST